jgi:hypothetical protein
MAFCGIASNGSSSTSVLGVFASGNGTLGNHQPTSMRAQDPRTGCEDAKDFASEGRCDCRSVEMSGSPLDEMPGRRRCRSGMWWRLWRAAQKLTKLKGLNHR